MQYGLAVDFGTTRSAGAVWSERGLEVLEFGTSRFLPSLVVVDDEGRLVAGRSAWNQSARLPRERVEFAPKRSVGQSLLVLGDRRLEPAELVALVIGQVAQEAARRFDGRPPERMVLTHPAGWAQSRLAVLEDATARAGLPAPELVPEPVAAARAYERESRLGEGATVAVYDLGGGTFDVAVMRRAAGGFTLCGPPGGDADVGGELFDERLMALVGAYAAAQDPDGWRRLREDQRRGEWAQFRRQLQEAKEILSEDERVHVHVPGTEAEVSVTRSEFESLIADDVERTISLFAETVGHAGVRIEDLDAIYLTGGASRIPLVERSIRDRLGIDPQRWGDPKAVVVTGAADAFHVAGRKPAGTAAGTGPGEPGAPAGNPAEPSRPLIERILLESPFRRVHEFDLAAKPADALAKARQGLAGESVKKATPTSATLSLGSQVAMRIKGGWLCRPDELPLKLQLDAKSGSPGCVLTVTATARAPGWKAGMHAKYATALELAVGRVREALRDAGVTDDAA